MEIQIRLAKLEDLETILELQDQSLRSLSLQVYKSRQIESLIKSQRAFRSVQDEVFLVAEANHELVGFAALMVRHPQISGIFVQPDWMGRGIGTKLLQAIEALAIEKNYRFVKVLSSLTAVGFYQARGYNLIRQSGFWSESNVWIPCHYLGKELIPRTQKAIWIGRILTGLICVILIVMVIRIFLP